MLPTNRLVITIILCLILAAGAGLRLYRLPSLLHFADDEGRDMMIAGKIAQGEEFPTLGPEASTHNFFLGPVFYYGMAVTLLIWDHPAAPAIWVAVFSLATIFLLYQLGARWWSRFTGLIMASLWSFSYLAVIQARWAWHPNLVPFFVILMIYCLYEIGQPSCSQRRLQGGGLCVILLFVAMAILVQLHATAFLLIPAIVVYWIFFPPRIHSPWPWTIGLLLAVGLTLPVLLFEMAHHWSNLRGAISQLQSGAPFRTDNRFIYVAREVSDVVNSLFFAGKFFWGGVTGGVAAVTGGLLSLRRYGPERLRKIRWFGLIGGLIFGSFYLLFSGQLFPHYFLIIVPFVIIFIGALVFYGRRSLILNAIVIVIAALISYAGISGTVTHLRALEDGTATGSYGVPLQDEEAAVAALAQRSLSEVDLCTVSTDSYRRAYEYLLGRKGINFTSEAMMQAVFYRVSENPDLASLTSDLSSFDQATFGTVGLLVGPKK